MSEKAFKIFGQKSFQHAIFYANESCLRFGLSEGSEFKTRISMFHTALSRATAILDTVFAKADKLSLCIAFYGDTFLENISQFKALQQLEISPPKDRSIRKEWDAAEALNRNYIFLTIEKPELHKWLFGKLADELGITPSFGFDLYIYDIDLGVLAHPYDDRGMDLVGTNKALLSKIYNEYHSWLLEYDLDAMKKWFGDVGGLVNE